MRDEIRKIKENAVIFESVMEDYDDLSDFFSSDNIDNSKLDERLKFELANFKLSAISAKFAELDIPLHSTILYQEISIAKVLLGEIGKKFMISDSYGLLFASLINNEEFPLSINRFKDVVLEEIIEPFGLHFGNPLCFTNTQKLFGEAGILKTEVLENIEEYLMVEAKRINIEAELEELLRK